MFDIIKIGSIEKEKIFWHVFDKRWKKFKWMIEQFDFNSLILIDEYRKEKNREQLLYLLVNIWLTKIPDSINIKNNQPGVSDILFMIDNEDFF